MKIILLKDVESVGSVGEIKEVKDGYARNYLIPKGLALTANKSNLKSFETIKKQQKSKKEKIYQHALRLKEKIEKFTLVIKAKSGEEGKLFGAVSSIDVLNGLKENGFADVEKGMIHMPESIRKIGKYVVELRLHPDVKAPLKVQVDSE